MKKYKIIVDTREQLPLFKTNIIRCVIKTGDYSLQIGDKNYSNRFAIERKSLTDLFNSLGGDRERFKKEIIRGLSMEYFAIVIEGSYTNCNQKDFSGAEFISKMKGSTITAILFTIHLKYKIPFFFTNGRVETKHIVKELLDSYFKIVRRQLKKKEV